MTGEQLQPNEISGMVVDCAVKIHQVLGPGLLESSYQRILAYELRKEGLEVATEIPIPIHWDGHTIDEGYRADIILNQSVLLELKSVERTLPVHKKQTLTYLKLAGLPLGLLINFGAPLMKNGIERLVNNLAE